MAKIPKLLHYCFGYDAGFGGKPWSLVHYVCVKSAIERLKPAQTYMYYEYEPKGVWWEQTRKMLTPVKIRAPREIFGNALEHVAHRTDVVRLETLIRQGGIYLDADVLVHQDFDHLLDNSVVIGQEGVNGEIGLANAVIMAEPGAPFLKKWYEEFRSFRSKGNDEYWNEHAVRVPLALSKMYPNELTILPHTAFYWPLWTHGHLELIYGSPALPEERSTLANHLWESKAWEEHLEFLTPGRVRKIDSNFHRWAKPFVVNLPDGFGGPSLVDRWSRCIRVQRRRFAPLIAEIRSKLSRARELGLLGSASHFIARTLPHPSGRRHRRRIFQEIYKKRLWGGHAHNEFYSGDGSRGIAAKSYVNHIADILIEQASHATKSINVVDLGCGDFEIGKHLVDQLQCIRYIGCDIVPELIAHNSSKNVDSRVQFKTLDIVLDELPDGDVCLIRQVFQHLSNADITKVLCKLDKFRKVYITEAYPVEKVGPVNPDKVTGSDVRYDWRNGRGRGVELDKDPYCLSTRELFRVAADPRQILITFEVGCFGVGDNRAIHAGCRLPDL